MLERALAHLVWTIQRSWVADGPTFQIALTWQASISSPGPGGDPTLAVIVTKAAMAFSSSRTHKETLKVSAMLAGVLAYPGS